MKRIIILGLLCLILLAACATTPEATEMVEARDAQCYSLTGITFVCEFRLSDGTPCASIVPVSSNGGVSITCNWK